MAPDRPQPIRNPLRARGSGERPSCHGVRGRSCPGRDRFGRRFERHLRHSAAGSPQLARPVPSPASLDRAFAVGRVSATSPIYFFFFFAAFLAFLFFAITSLHQRLKKQAQRPSNCCGRFDRRDKPGSESLSRPAHRATENLLFTALILLHPQDFHFNGKKFSAALHIISKAARSISQ